MKTLQTAILVPVLLLNAAAGFPVARGDKYASWDDVNVVAHGLLQLGQGLREHVVKTKAQMRDVNSQLKAFNATVISLEGERRERDQAPKAGREEKERADGETMKQTEDIRSRVNALEQKVDRALKMTTRVGFKGDNATALFIQRAVAAQNRRIDHLLDKIRQQQDKLDKQSLHLLTLQDKASVSPSDEKNNGGRRVRLFTLTERLPLFQVGHRGVRFLRHRHEEATPRGDSAQSDTKAGFAQDCHDLFVRGRRTSGVYTIQAQNSRPFNVLCQMTPEGGWTVIQKRLDGSENFNHLWESYQKGFGSLNGETTVDTQEIQDTFGSQSLSGKNGPFLSSPGEFWLGLENIRAVSEQGQYLLQVELTDSTGESHANLYRVQIDGEEKNYALHLEQNSTSGARGGSLTTGAAGLPFSTADRDNDLAADVNCAELHSGGWWFGSCGGSNLNGKYPRRPGGPVRWQPRRMFWTDAMGQKNSPRTTLMKLAPISINQQ